MKKTTFKVRALYKFKIFIKISFEEFSQIYEMKQLHIPYYFEISFRISEQIKQLDYVIFTEPIFPFISSTNAPAMRFIKHGIKYINQIESGNDKKINRCNGLKIIFEQYLGKNTHILINK